MQKFEYLKNEQSFLDELKKVFFIVFEGLSFGKKSSGHKRSHHRVARWQLHKNNSFSNLNHFYNKSN